MDVMEIRYEIERDGCRLGATASLDPGEDVSQSYEKLERLVEQEHARFGPHRPRPVQQLWAQSKPAIDDGLEKAQWVESTLGNGAFRLGNYLCCKVPGAATVVRTSFPDGTTIALTEQIVQLQALLCDMKKTA